MSTTETTAQKARWLTVQHLEDYGAQATRADLGGLLNGEFADEDLTEAYAIAYAAIAGWEARGDVWHVRADVPLLLPTDAEGVGADGVQRGYQVVVTNRLYAEIELAAAAVELVLGPLEWVGRKSQPGMYAPNPSGGEVVIERPSVVRLGPRWAPPAE